jgi:4,5-DOPA dioxygenase extradiol
MNPTLFLPHGAPTFALHPGPAGAAIAGFSARLEKPEAILIASAHWNTSIPSLGSSEEPETVHDYWGFPDSLYEIVYPAKGSPELAHRAAKLLNGKTEERRGLDHGAWIPLRLLYPDASIQVVPLSIQYGMGPKHHFDAGRKLAPLRKEGVLIVSSGNLTHNLSHYRPGMTSIPSYVTEFSGWVREKLGKKDLDSLLDYRHRAPGAQLAHPTDEHLLPLFVALGAAGDGFGTEFIFDGVYEGMLAMDAFSFT